MSDPAKTGGMIGEVSVSSDMDQEQQNDVRAIVKLFKQWKQVRDMYSKPWLDYYHLYRGKQWNSNRAAWKNSEVVNLIWQSIQSTAPMQTDARPRFVFLPAEPSDLEFSQLIEKISDQDWDKWGWMQTALEVILDGYIYGTGISSMKYDQELEYGIGAPVYRSEEPFYIFPDPDCNDINDEKSEGFFHAYPCTTSKLKAKYPKWASKIKPDCKDWLKAQKAAVKTDSFYSFYNSTSMQMPAETFDSGADNADSIEKTLVIEGYLKPNDIDELVTQDENGEKTYTIKKKYPRGRHVVIANGILLEDHDYFPFEDGLIPYDKYCNYVDGRNFWGISEIEQLESPQRVFNKILSYAIDIMLYTSNPGWIVSTDADVDHENITNQPGQVIVKSPSGTVERFSASQLPPHFMQMQDRLVSWFNDVGGQSDFSKGEAPGGVTAASAIEQLISASRTRIRQKQRNLDVYLKGVGRKYLNRVMQYYTIPRIYRMTEKDGRQFWLKFYLDKKPGEPNPQNPDQTQDMKTVAVLQSYFHDETGRVIAEPEKIIYLRGELDVRVQAGSDLPFEAADKERKALALFDRQIIDAQEVLDQLQYPNKDKILARIQEQQQMAAQQAAAQQQEVPQQ
jgi:hypothetical protein